MSEPVVVLREPDGFLTVATTTLTLAELFDYYHEAKATMLGALQGDPECRADVERVIRLAEGAPPMQRGRAVIMAYVMQIAMREIREEQVRPAADLQVVEARSPKVGPTELRPCGHPGDFACGCAPEKTQQATEAA